MGIFFFKGRNRQNVWFCLQNSYMIWFWRFSRKRRGNYSKINTVLLDQTYSFVTDKTEQQMVQKHAKHHLCKNPPPRPTFYANTLKLKVQNLFPLLPLHSSFKKRLFHIVWEARQMPCASKEIFAHSTRL